MTWFWLLACSPEASDCAPGFLRDEGGNCVPAPEARDSGDSGDSAPPSDEGFTLGPVQSCEQPASPAWTQHTLQGFELTGISSDPASVVAFEHEGQVLLAASHGSHAVAWWGVDGSLQGQTETQDGFGRFAIVDLDGDGALDLLRWAMEVEIRWSFLEQSHDSVLLQIPDSCKGPVDVLPQDLDHDGDLDLLLAAQFGCEDDRSLGVARNQGGRDFDSPEPLSEQAEFLRSSVHVVSFDLDQDGDPDALTCSGNVDGGHGSVLWRNDGAGQMLPEAGPIDEASCMSTSQGDLDGDGQLDLFAAGLSPEDGEVSQVWSSALGDLDNDGQLDLVLAVGDFQGIPDRGFYPLQVFLQEQGELVEQASALGLDEELDARGVLTQDLNGDGALDLFVAQREGEPRLWLSQTCLEGHWLAVEAPAGTLVEARAGEQRFTALVDTHPGFASQGLPRAHLGLGQVPELDELVLHPPWSEAVRLRGPIQVDRVVGYSPP